MLNSFSSLTIAVLTLFATIRNVAADDVDVAPPAADLVVHEWGTFTSFSGSNGLQLEFRPLVNGELPSFVIDPYYQAYGAFTKSFRSFQRMETPVIYFYTPNEMTVDVRVEFPQGLLTEYYPPVSAFAPSLDARGEIQAMIDNGQLGAIDWADPSVGGSSLDWNDVHLIPTSLLRPQVADEELASVIQQNTIFHLMPYDEGNHYGHARETDAALVLFQPGLNPEAPQTDPAPEQVPFETVWMSEQFPISGISGIDHFFEKFLFYRGIGNLSLPFEATFSSDDVIRVSNSGTDGIGAVFLVVSDGTEEGLRFSQHAGLGSAESIDVSLDEVGGSLEQLVAALTATLVSEGLYQREAEAMVATWRSSWFLEPGTRLFYLVPQQLTDELLPLAITPQPAETVRVMVGRMEMMTPSRESRILDAVSQSASARQEAYATAAAAGVDAPLMPVPEEIASMGRWAEPALVRISQIATDAAVRNEAQQLINELRAQAWEAIASQGIAIPEAFE